MSEERELLKRLVNGADTDMSVGNYITHVATIVSEARFLLNPSPPQLEPKAKLGDLVIYGGAPHHPFFLSDSREIPNVKVHSLQLERDQLKTENERMREALEEVETATISKWQSWYAFSCRLQGIAKRALEDQQ